MHLNACWAQTMRMDILASQLQDAQRQANVLDESLSRCVALARLIAATFATTGAAAAEPDCTVDCGPCTFILGPRAMMHRTKWTKDVMLMFP